MGRKPVILMTIFGNGFFCLLFGFTINLPMALATRFFAGLANGKCFLSLEWRESYWYSYRKKFIELGFKKKKTSLVYIYMWPSER
jgi:MFS family permease